MAQPPGIAKFVSDRKASDAQLTAAKGPTVLPGGPKATQVAPKPSTQSSGQTGRSALFHGHTLGKGK